jgi:MoaA/NifB/PqqE/SkfB family radical SAM enzyme
MKLSGLHLLLTYQCNLECDHCFVWGSPWQSGTMTLTIIQEILKQGKDLGTVKWIYFEGGEPFLYYAVLVKGVQEAAQMDYQVGIVSNGYWATDENDAIECLKPFAGLIQDLTVSSDLYHYSEKLSRQAQNANKAADELGIPVCVITIAQPEETEAVAVAGQLPAGESSVLYRGRAAEKLVARAAQQPWSQFRECAFENLREPGRVHVDPFGNLHICQGIAIGNLFHAPLKEICEAYNPDSHPIAGPLLEGGPVELIRRYGLSHAETYADACHLCYEARRALRERFPEILGPDQMYGVLGEE